MDHPHDRKIYELYKDKKIARGRDIVGNPHAPEEFVRLEKDHRYGPPQRREKADPFPGIPGDSVCVPTLPLSAALHISPRNVLE
jgi:hypothetical protein